MESKCWKKNPDLIPDKVKAAQKKQAEKKAEKAAAVVDDDEMILSMQEFNMNKTFTSVPIDESIVFLKNIFEDDDGGEVLEPNKVGIYDLDLSQCDSKCYC